MAVKSKVVELTKGVIRESAIKELTWRGATVWPQNNLAVRGRKFIGRKGVADVIGFSRAGLFIACEVKTVNDFLSDDQKDFLNDVKKFGGLAFIACQTPTGQVELKEW